MDERTDCRDVAHVFGDVSIYLLGLA
jgi:hypothetical protein